jgi:hypothetical protein
MDSNNHSVRGNTVNLSLHLASEQDYAAPADGRADLATRQLLFAQELVENNTCHCTVSEVLRRTTAQNPSFQDDFNGQERNGLSPH